MATIVLDSDTFTRANTTASSTISTGWGTASSGSSWSVTTGTATYSIASNEGHATNCTASTNMVLGSTSAAAVEGLVRVKTNNSSTTRMGISIRCNGSTTFYMARLSANANTFAISKVVSGTTTDLFSTAFTVTTGSFYWIKFRAIGTTLEAKVWLDGNSEPGSWTVSGTDSSITAAGTFGLTINSSSSATTWDFDSLSINNGTSNQTAQVRLRLQVQRTKTAQTRTRLQVLRTLTAQVRTILSAGTLRTRTAQVRLRLPSIRTRTAQIRLMLNSPRTRTAQLRLRLRITNTQTAQVRLVLATPSILNGGFTLFANGTGTVNYGHVRWTEYPDPSLSLSTVTPRVGATSIAWNALVPTNTTLGVDVSFDGVTWTDVTASNGGALPGIYSQPDPSIDGFDENTSANYTSTFRTGGAAASPTYDTAYSRLILTGGTNALYVYNAISRADVDFFADLDQSDAGGLVWRYIDANNFYYLRLNDTLSSTGTLNTATLYKVASNVQTTLGSATIAYTVGLSTGSSYTVNFTRGTFRRFRVTMLAGVITVYCDGNQLLTYTDGSPLGAGLMGLYNNGGTTGSRYYQLWMSPQGDYVTGTPSGDIVTGQFVYTRLRLATTDPTATPQVEDITTNAFTPDISEGVLIPSVTYNASFISKNFDDLAKQSNYPWYFDKRRKAMVFRSSDSVYAPWILQSSPAGIVSTVDLEVDDNLELDVENDLYRNRQIILGALDTGTFSETQVGDNSTRTFTLGYPLASAPSISLNGIVDASVGLKGTTGFDYYYALNDPIIVQDSSLPLLQSTDQLAVTYSGFFATTVVVDDVAQQQARALIEGGTGIVESVEDHTGQNMTLDAATTLATQLLERYAIAGRTLIFDTSRDGLELGMNLSIFLPEHAVWDGQFMITQIEITLQKGLNDTQVYWYKVTASELPKQDSWAKLIASGLGLEG